MVKLLSFLPRISLQVRPSLHTEQKKAKMVRVANEVRMMALELGVGEDWREVQALFSTEKK